MRKPELFVALVKEMLTFLGAEQRGDEFIFQTRAGRLVLHPTENETDGPGTIFGRFDDPKAARQFVDCNPCSGKWNHHYFGGWTVETAIADFLSWLGKVLPHRPPNDGHVRTT